MQVAKSHLVHRSLVKARERVQLMVPDTLAPIQLVTLAQTVKSLRVLHSHVITEAHSLCSTTILLALIQQVILERVKQRLAQLVPVSAEVVQFRLLGIYARCINYAA